MRTWHVIVVGLAGLACSACRTHPMLAELERENFELENKIYELDGLLEDKHRDLAACRAENEKLRGQLERARAGAEAGGLWPLPGFPEPRPGEKSATPGPAPGGSEKGRQEEPGLPGLPVDPQSIRPPEVILPSDSSSPGGTLPSVQPPAVPKQPGPTPAFPLPLPQAPPPARGVPGHGGPAGSQDQLEPLRDNRQVVAVMLSAALTGGLDLDPRPGDEGITVCLEPRGEDGELVRAAAPVAIVAVDPAVRGPEGRVGRWDLSSKAVAEAWRASAAGQGVRLTLPWTGAPPRHGQLRLFVRYSTDDGRVLEAQRDITVRVAEASSTSWTAATRAEPGGSADLQASPWRHGPLSTPVWDDEPASPAPPKRPRPSWSPYRDR